jgi:hypothetical protein
MHTLVDFLNESNAIEGIPSGNIKTKHIDAAESFLELPTLYIADIENIVRAFQPDGELRDKPGLNVRVGNYRPPLGSIEMREHLQAILEYASKGQCDPEMAYRAHHN